MFLTGLDVILEQDKQTLYAVATPIPQSSAPQKEGRKTSWKG